MAINAARSEARVLSSTKSKVKVVGVYFMNTGHEMTNVKRW